MGRCLSSLRLSQEGKRKVTQRLSFEYVFLFSYYDPSEALAASVVKVAGRDVLATWKVLISLGVAPVLYGLYAFLATLVTIKANAPLKWRIWTPFLVIVALPFMNYAALKFGEAGVDVLKCVSILSQFVHVDHVVPGRCGLS